MLIKPIPSEFNTVSQKIIDAAFTVHSTLGPGLLENIYEICLCHELQKRGLNFKRQVCLPIIYDDLHLEAGLRLDLLVEGCVIIELKSVETILSLHIAQLLTYLKLSGHRLGLLINFNVTRLKDGIKRLVL